MNSYFEHRGDCAGDTHTFTGTRGDLMVECRTCAAFGMAPEGQEPDPDTPRRRGPIRDRDIPKPVRLARDGWPTHRRRAKHAKNRANKRRRDARRGLITDEKDPR